MSSMDPTPTSFAPPTSPVSGAPQTDGISGQSALYGSQDGTRKPRKFEVKPVKKPTSPETLEANPSQGAGSSANDQSETSSKDEKSTPRDDSSDAKVQKKGRFTVIEKGPADDSKDAVDHPAAALLSPTTVTAALQSTHVVQSIQTAPAAQTAQTAQTTTQAPAAQTAPAAHPAAGLAPLDTRTKELSPTTSSNNLLAAASGNSNKQQDQLHEQLQQIYTMNSLILQRLETITPTPSNTATPMSKRAAEIANEATMRRPDSATNGPSSRASSKDKNLERLRNYLTEMRSELEAAASQRDDLETVMRALKERNTSLERRLEDEKTKRQQLEKKLKTEQKKLSTLQSQLEVAAAQNPHLRAILTQLDVFSSTEDGAAVQTTTHQSKFASTPGQIQNPIPVQFGSQPGQPPVNIVQQFPTPFSAAPNGIATTATTTTAFASTGLEGLTWPVKEDVFAANSADTFGGPIADPWPTTTLQHSHHHSLNSAMPMATLQRMPSNVDIMPSPTGMMAPMNGSDPLAMSMRTHRPSIGSTISQAFPTGDLLS